MSLLSCRLSFRAALLGLAACLDNWLLPSSSPSFSSVSALYIERLLTDFWSILSQRRVASNCFFAGGSNFVLDAVWAPFGRRHKKGRLPRVRISTFMMVFDNKIKYLKWCPGEDLNIHAPKSTSTAPEANPVQVS